MEVLAAAVDEPRRTPGPQEIQWDSDSRLNASLPERNGCCMGARDGGGAG